MTYYLSHQRLHEGKEHICDGKISDIFKNTKPPKKTLPIYFSVCGLESPCYSFLTQTLVLFVLPNLMQLLLSSLWSLIFILTFYCLIFLTQFTVVGNREQK